MNYKRIYRDRFRKKILKNDYLKVILKSNFISSFGCHIRSFRFYILFYPAYGCAAEARVGVSALSSGRCYFSGFVDGVRNGDASAGLAVVVGLCATSSHCSGDKAG